MRAGFSLRLKPDGLAEYKRRHDEIWPELVQELAKNGIEQITIFVTGSTLFIYSEVDNEDAWQALWHTDIHLRWAKDLEPYMELDADGTPASTDLTEIFHIRPQEAAIAD
jgi:L-rhamnose mutarotase